MSQSLVLRSWYAVLLVASLISNLGITAFLFLQHDKREDLRKEVSALRETKEQLRENVRVFEAKEAELKGAVGSWQIRLREKVAADMRIAKEEEELSQIRRSLEAARGDINKAKTESESLQVFVTKLRQEKVDLEAHSNKKKLLDDDIAQGQMAAAKIEASLTKARLDATLAEQKLETLSSETEAAQKRLNGVASTFVSERGRLDSARKEQAQAENERLEADIARKKLEQGQKELNQEVADLKARRDERDVVKHEVGILRADKSALESSTARLRATNDLLEGERKDLLKAVSELDAKKELVSTQLKKLEDLRNDSQRAQEKDLPKTPEKASEKKD